MDTFDTIYITLASLVLLAFIAVMTLVVISLIISKE